MKIAVFVSGGGTNLRNIIQAIETGELKNVQIEKVIADRDCYAIEIAEKEGLEVLRIKRGEDWQEEVNAALDSVVDLIVLAGFLSILPASFCEKWQRKMINVHPSLLPKYGGKGMYGAKVHQAVLDAKEKKSGATVHYVTQEIDEGEIIVQRSYAVEEGDKVSDLQRKVQSIEQEIMIEALNIIKDEYSSIIR